MTIDELFRILEEDYAGDHLAMMAGRPDVTEFLVQGLARDGSDDAQAARRIYREQKAAAAHGYDVTFTFHNTAAE